MIDDGILLAVGFDEAFIGIGYRAGSESVAVYDRTQCVNILSRQMSPEDAEDYFEVNVVGSYVGPRTPIFVELVDDMLDNIFEVNK